MNVLSVRGLCKRYGSFALRDVSFDVAPGSITGFIGRNGAGNSALSRRWGLRPAASGFIPLSACAL